VGGLLTKVIESVEILKLKEAGLEVVDLSAATKNQTEAGTSLVVDT